MLNIKCQEHFDKVKAFAKEQGLLEQLEKQLNYLNFYGGGEEDPNYCRCDLYYDFAPYSFSFVLYRTREGEEPKMLMNGGLIFQGPKNPANGMAPSYTVSLAEGTGWFVHT
jgi:uncharacterized protein DUF4120